MTVQITVIGLGQIGTSIGLALEPQKERILRVGHDRNMDISRQVEKMGAFDKIIHNLHASVEQADIVILAIHEDQIRNTLEQIARDLKEGAVIMDTSTSMIKVGSWMKELLPPDRYFATISPTINPNYMDTLRLGPDEARADLFKKSALVITSPAGMPADAIRLATELAGLLGADAFYADPYEFDGLVASSKVLPLLLSAAFVNATVDQPGWREGRRLAGKYYHHMTSPMMFLPEGESLEKLAMMDRENVVRVINNLMYALMDIRDAVQEEDREKLDSLIKHAKDSQAEWYNQRMGANWEKDQNRSEIPSAGENLSRFFTGGLFKTRDDKK
ncbi:MAG: prephenate dehydrogenase/arogenate dehydrogenase family protein [Chloroflexi bacterium]|nr:prephenate dehydrogenase/arogenate dehydrogenase family protein [Chloroflexota bacterium]